MARSALITGASSGIGLATARLLHSRGYRVALVARTAGTLQDVAADLGEGAFAFPCDVGKLDSLPNLVENVVESLGSIDVLVNNAGVHHRGSMLRHSPEELAQMIVVNTAAPIALSRIVVDHMLPGSVIVNVASLAGKVPVPGSATYSGSKAGLRFWALSAAEDLAQLGVRVVNVNPGPVDSGFFDHDIDNVSPITFSQPMSTVEQVAQAVLSAIDSEASPMEIDLPYASGKLATLGYIAPPVRRILRPALEKRGAKVKEQLKRDKGQG